MTIYDKVQCDNELKRAERATLYAHHALLSHSTAEFRADWVRDVYRDEEAIHRRAASTAIANAIGWTSR